MAHGPFNAHNPLIWQYLVDFRSQKSIQLTSPGITLSSTIFGNFDSIQETTLNSNRDVHVLYQKVNINEINFHKNNKFMV